MDMEILDPEGYEIERFLTQQAKIAIEKYLKKRGMLP